MHERLAKLLAHTDHPPFYWDVSVIGIIWLAVGTVDYGGGTVFSRVFDRFREKALQERDGISGWWCEVVSGYSGHPICGAIARICRKDRRYRIEGYNLKLRNGEMQPTGESFSGSVVSFDPGTSRVLLYPTPRWW